MSQASGSRSDLWGGAVWVAVGALIAFESLRMERFESMGATVYTYPGFVPGLIGAVVALLGLLLMARGWRASAVRGDRAPFFNTRVLMALGLSLAYCLLLLTRVHFVLATALFVAAFTFLFTDAGHARSRRVAVACGSGVITALVVFFVFQEIFLVRLP
ncbi:MAG: hypothetical protein RIS88_1315 [Pseudomonadota bacterium]|jgi:hypothetical protein